MEDKSLILVQALKSGKILFKHYSKVNENEFLFMEIPNYFEIKGWGAAIGAPSERVIELITNPEDWNIHEHTMEMGYPYPWSILYKK